MKILLCEICKRELGNELIDEHHLIPKTFKGKHTVSLHKICHRKIHSLFSERELLNYYNTVDRILESEDIQTFVSWIKNKPLNFYVSSKDSTDRKSKRRR